MAIGEALAGFAGGYGLTKQIKEDRKLRKQLGDLAERSAKPSGADTASVERDGEVPEHMPNRHGGRAPRSGNYRLEKGEVIIPERLASGLKRERRQLRKANRKRSRSTSRR